MCSKLLTRCKDNPVSLPHSCEQQSKHWNLCTGGGGQSEKAGCQRCCEIREQFSPRWKSWAFRGQRLWTPKWSHAHVRRLFTSAEAHLRPPTSVHNAAICRSTFNNEPLGGSKAPHTACHGTSEGTERKPT